LATAPYALSNTAGDFPSGHYDPRNTRISYEDAGKKITVYATDGSIRDYHFKRRLQSGFQLYFLGKEILPNGKILKYHHDTAEQLYLIESLDPKERYTYASMRITGCPRNGNCHFTSSSGQTVDYNYKINRIQWEIKEKVKGRKKKLRRRVNAPCPLFSPPSAAPSIAMNL
jgi:hypothetical protein